MHIVPINDNNSRFDLVEVKSTNSCNPTPHCKIHGAMNCVAVHANGKLWRCVQSKDLKDCRAGCEEKEFQNLNKILNQDELYKMLEIKFFHPFNFFFHKRPKFDTNWHPSDDLYQYGFSLDLTTEAYYYTYDWGYGFSLRVLGLGFEITKVKK